MVRTAFLRRLRSSAADFFAESAIDPPSPPNTLCEPSSVFVIDSDSSTPFCCVPEGTKEGLRSKGVPRLDPVLFVSHTGHSSRSTGPFIDVLSPWVVPLPVLHAPSSASPPRRSTSGMPISVSHQSMAIRFARTLQAGAPTTPHTPATVFADFL